MQRRLYAREEGKRERQAREQRREEMRKIVDAQKRAQLLEQEVKSILKPRVIQSLWQQKQC